MSAHLEAPPRLSRSELANALSLLDCEINFVTLHELLSLHFSELARGGWADHRVRCLATLERARQAPMFRFLEGVRDPVELANGLADAIRLDRPFHCANQGAALGAQALFRQRNGAAHWIEIAAGCY